MKVMLSFIFAFIIGSTVNGTQAASNEVQASTKDKLNDVDRWCLVSNDDTANRLRQCYFHTHSECRRFLIGSDGACLPSEFHESMPH
jgi:hypothetical protein